MPITITKDQTKEAVKSVKALTSKEVLIGIPAENDGRTDSTFGNAGIGFINEFGSPVQNIPPRPHLVPGVEHALFEALPHVRKAGEAAMDMREGVDPLVKIQAEMEIAGQICVDSVRDTIQQGLAPALKPATIAARARRGQKGAMEYMKQFNSTEAKAARAMGLSHEISGDLAKPLIDTGAYYQAITFVVRNK